jgi:hypothetical protein
LPTPTKWLSKGILDADGYLAALMSSKRPKPRSMRDGQPVRDPNPELLIAAAELAVYIGSPKHKRGLYQGAVGHPGPNPTTIEQARGAPPTPPFTTLCDLKWNERDPSKEATELLRSAIRKGQIGHPIDEGLPKYVWARDPEDPSIVYEARRLSVPSHGYKAYPLIEPQVATIGMTVL